MVSRKKLYWAEHKEDFVNPVIFSTEIFFLAKLRDGKVETFTRLFPSVDAFSVVCRRGLAGVPFSQGSVGQHL